MNTTTTDTFIIEIQRDGMDLELPYNMPLKVTGENFQAVVLQKAFLNFLPLEGPLMSPMQHPPDPITEWVFPLRETYFNMDEAIWMAHIPYFSNCRGFGRTIPFSAIVEQGRVCRHVDPNNTR